MRKDDDTVDTIWKDRPKLSDIIKLNLATGCANRYQETPTVISYCMHGIEGQHGEEEHTPGFFGLVASALC